MANKIYATRNPDITPREIDHMALSRSLAGECVVLDTQYLEDSLEWMEEQK